MRLLIALAAFTLTQALPLPDDDAIGVVWQFPNTTWIENLAVRANGEVLCTSLSADAIFMVNPFAYTEVTVHQFEAGSGVLGITVGGAEPTSQVLPTFQIDVSKARKTVVFLMADYGHDPTETAVPYKTFRDAGCEIRFATETGKKPRCDEKMLSGWTQKLLGADAATIATYHEMEASLEWTEPLAWTREDFQLTAFDLVFLPGRHDKGVRQIIDSQHVHGLLVDYFAVIRKPSRKACAAICHGVQVLAHSRKEDGTSVLHDLTTTALPGTSENTADYGTRAFLGDYYKTYGAGTPNVEDVVRGELKDAPTQWQSSLNLAVPFVVEDGAYNYLSGRWPGDAKALAEKTLGLWAPSHV
ncbi:hypothetical protein LTR22_000902 [Elasticomyces elasticus]|nr:hypothetical protein LTR22_000902 [Elasticomyces elasticus]